MLPPKDERRIATNQQLDAMADKRRSDSLLLTRRHDTDWAQHLYRDQTLRGVEEARAEQDVTYDLVLLFRHERKSFASRYGVAKGRRQDSQQPGRGSERRQMDCPYGRPIALRFSAHIHFRERSWREERRGWRTPR